jgi:hypothetical protein
LRQPHQTTARESIEWPLAKPAEARHWPPAPSDHNLTAPLYALQVLAEAVMELTDSDLALGLM